ncbi:MAG: hypothetical protein ACREQP_24055, partial [Candidatus Binatia bacterium]
MLHQTKGVFCLLVVVLAGALAFSAAPARALQDVRGDIPPRVVGEIPGAPVGYCHLKFPAIDEKTLGTGFPRLERPDSGNIIDFYGPCDHDPLGAEEVQRQMNENQLE